MNNLVQKNVKINWNKAFKDGTDKQFPSLELVRVDKIFFKWEAFKTKLLETTWNFSLGYFSLKSSINWISIFFDHEFQ